MSSSAPSLLWVQSSPLARRLFFHLHVIGQTRVKDRAEFGRLAKPGAALVWLVSGRGELRIGSDQWELKPPPQFYVYGAGQPRVFVPAAGQSVTTRFFWWGGSGLPAWLEELGAARNPVFRLRAPQRLFRAHDRLLQLVKHQPPAWEWSVHLLLTGVLKDLLLARRLLGAVQPNLPPSLARALRALEADRARDWQARELAAEAGLGYSAFRALFRQHLRETPHEHIQRARLDLARELLAGGQLRIKEIAQRLHFANEHYFSSFFHRRAGVTPTEFRKHLSLRTE